MEEGAGVGPVLLKERGSDCFTFGSLFLKMSNGGEDGCTEDLTTPQNQKKDGVSKEEELEETIK